MNKYFQVCWSKKQALQITLTPILILALVMVAINFLEINEQIEQMENPIFAQTGLYLLQSLILLFPLWIISRKLKLKTDDYGFKKVSLVTTIRETLLHYLLFIGVSAIVAAIIIFTQYKIPGYQAQPSLFPSIANDALSISVLAFITIIIAPFVEEIFFRGFLLRTLIKHHDIFLGSVLSAAIFAVFHLQFQSIIPIFILGLIINSIVIRTKSIWPAIAFHMFNNAIAFTVQYAIFSNDLPVDALFS